MKKARRWCNRLTRIAARRCGRWCGRTAVFWRESRSADFDVFSSRVSLSSAEKIQYLLDGRSEQAGGKRMPSQSVLVIGGGLAGLSSAVALAEAGFACPPAREASPSGRTRYFLHAARRQRSGQLPARHARLLHEPRGFLSPRGRGRENSSFTTRSISRMRRAAGRRSKASSLPRAAASWRHRFVFFGGLTLADKLLHRKGAARDCRSGREAAGIEGNFDARLAAADEADAGSDRAFLARGAGERA